MQSAVFIKKSFLYPIKYLLLVVRPILVQPIIFFLMLVRIFAEIVLWILNLRFPPFMFNGMALKDLSATCKAKLQLCYLNMLNYKNTILKLEFYNIY